MQRIGNYRLDHEGGRWTVTDRAGAVVGSHHSKWDAIREARDLNWREVHEKKRPPVTSVTGGSEEPKSKWRWSYIGGFHG